MRSDGKRIYGTVPTPYTRSDFERDHVEITGCDLRELVRDAYGLSLPQGLGQTQYRAGPLPDHECDAVVGASQLGSRGFFEGDELTYALDADYIFGRSVKLRVTRTETEQRLWMEVPWYDHTPEQQNLLLAVHRTREQSWADWTIERTHDWLVSQPRGAIVLVEDSAAGERFGADLELLIGRTVLVGNATGQCMFGGSKLLVHHWGDTEARLHGIVSEGLWLYDTEVHGSRWLTFDQAQAACRAGDQAVFRTGGIRADIAS